MGNHDLEKQIEQLIGKDGYVRYHGNQKCKACVDPQGGSIWLRRGPNVGEIREEECKTQLTGHPSAFQDQHGGKREPTRPLA